VKGSATTGERDTSAPPSRHREYPSLTVDIVTVALRAGRPQVLLVRRRNPPFVGCWAIPGGFVDPCEPLEAAARRELREETGAQPRHLEQLHTFGDPGRDPRGWTISVAYLALVDKEEPLRAGSDAGEVGWFDLHDPPPLAFDHAGILACAVRRLAERGYSPGSLWGC
jgi:8-oxo-dGTP diphosphatase